MVEGLNSDRVQLGMLAYATDFVHECTAPVDATIDGLSQSPSTVKILHTTLQNGGVNVSDER